MSSNIIPNQGDYISLFADGSSLYACWSDGRPVTGVSNPDIYASVWPLALTPTQLALTSATAEPGRIRLEWFVAATSGFSATLERAHGDGPWTALATLVPDGEGRVQFEDTDVLAGETYHYRLAVTEGSATRWYGEATLRVPEVAAFAIEDVRPNPASQDAWVSFSLPDDRPARVQVLDVSGRAVAEPRLVQGAGRQLLRISDGQLPAGLYLVRLTQGGHSLVSRFSIVR